MSVSEEGRTTTNDDQAMQARLAEIGRRIAQIASRAQQARADTRLRVERRVKVLRARDERLRQEAVASGSVHARARDGSWAVLERELDELDIEIGIAESQLDLDSADDSAAFEAAVTRQIDAYRAYVRLLQAPDRPVGVEAVDPSGASVEAIGRYTAAADARLQRYRALSSEVSDSLRAGVLAALDHLDRAVDRTRPTNDG